MPHLVSAIMKILRPNAELTQPKNARSTDFSPPEYAKKDTSGCCRGSLRTLFPIGFPALTT